jgi:hypothetical protein
MMHDEGLASALFRQILLGVAYPHANNIILYMRLPLC